MRSIQETEEEQTDTEITLGMKSLLGVFFGLVLICGVFFGLGYSLGRGSSSPKAVSRATPDSPAEATSPKPAALPPVTSTPSQDDSASASTYTPGPDARVPETTPAALPRKPSASGIKPVGAGPVGDAAASTPARPTPVAASPTTTPIAVKASPSAPSASSAATPAPAAQGSVPVSQTMVQVAAVSRQEDANVLVAALRKLGYSAVVRNDPKDNLLHIQIGPFATRDEARAMRAKLLADGYNAIFK
jgi:DedD protein